MRKSTRTRTADSLQDQLKEALHTVPNLDFTNAARDLLNLLGYQSDRTLIGQTGEVDDFIRNFPADSPDTKSEQEFRNACSSLQILFQVTGTEIAAQQHLFDTSHFDHQNSSSFIFVASELNRDTYPRGHYARFTREINKRLNQPTVVLFKTAEHRLTLAFVHRRPHKRDPDRDVLGRVSLIREINPTGAHRAHLDILSELSLSSRVKWMDTRGKSLTFDSLLEAWLDALDTEALNKKFYRELFDWFTQATKDARFPTDQARTLPPEEHVIRLITRLLFIWFIKEKGLVSNDLFTEERIRPLIEDYDRETGDSYYRVVLQNLFFATLNTEIDRRGFSETKPTTHRNFSLYRHKAEMTDRDALVKLFDRTPFINGGLFDCLDSEEGMRAGGYRIDCFSDHPPHRDLLSIPNRLFFGSAGLIDLFNRYRFTVEENTPIEQEVALDPELLGKVFENLLAAYNPETRATARKQTGSYYTPRKVVDYMVEEALIAFLGESVPSYDDDTDYWQDRLRYLLDYADAFDDAEELFEPTERQALIRAIADITVLDPAVGSGAFPMAVLHRLTLALRRLDPDNHEWERLQKDLAGTRAKAAFETLDQQERDAQLAEISDTFEKYRDSDFGRKLYLIQNSIFGVDIQPIACQIAKLRFFISLAIEQEPNSDPTDNYGIKPLPNLETRFVAADTLLGMHGQRVLTNPRTQELDKRLRANRDRYFHATTRRQKLDLSRENNRLRSELASELRDLGMPPDLAERIAKWDQFDQNAKADWFDAPYMFDRSDGFDVVIGNPPYIQLQRDRGKLANHYRNAGYTTFARTGDIYQLFYEKGCQLLRPGEGVLAYITSNSWLKAQYGQKLRLLLSEAHSPLTLVEMGKDVFEATVDTNVLLLREGNGQRPPPPFPAVDIDTPGNDEFPPPPDHWGSVLPEAEGPWRVLSEVEQRVLAKMRAKGTPLGQWDVKINYGIKTGCNDAFIIDSDTRDALIAQDPRSAEIIKPMLRGRDIGRYQVKWAGLYLITTHNGYRQTLPININDYPAIKQHLDQFYLRLTKRHDQGATPYNLRSCAYQEDFKKEKLFWMDMSPEGRFAYSDTELYCVDKGFVMTGSSLKYLCAILNSSVVTWLVKATALTTGAGLMQWKKFTVESIPVPEATPADQRLLIETSQVIAAEASDRAADTKTQEAQINGTVYKLYGLTEEEKVAIEYSMQ